MTAYHITLICLAAVFLLAVGWLVMEWLDRRRWRRLYQAVERGQIKIMDRAKWSEWWNQP